MAASELGCCKEQSDASVPLCLSSKIKPQGCLERLGMSDLWHGSKNYHEFSTLGERDMWVPMRYRGSNGEGERL
ncbi:unnamed protein product [Prunus armeniaca]